MNPESRNIFTRNQAGFCQVVSFNAEKDRLIKMDFTEDNKDLTANIIEDTGLFGKYTENKLSAVRGKFGYGGYAEHRTIYSRSRVFDPSNVWDEPRRLHLGIDIWGAAGTPVFAPLGGMVHGFAFNNDFGDYGATIILLHQLDGFPFYTLYGHLSLDDIRMLNDGQYIIRGEQVGRFGQPHENGHWPPHLHFQVIFDIGMYEGDYPGVCKFSEREMYLSNCPDPDLILQMRQYEG